MPSNHPDRHELLSFSGGQLSSKEMQQIYQHVENCGDCCERLDQLTDDTLLELVRNASTKTETEVVDNNAAIPTDLKDHPRYKVLRHIGSGGMGSVYLAEHRLMDRLVALKVINPALLKKPEIQTRFQREVRAAAKIGHPNIVAAFDAEMAGETHFLVMEYIPGTRLDRRVQLLGPLSIEDGVRFGRQAALALAHAHSRNMIHRDIKPQNIIISSDGQLKVLDFGLARLTDSPAIHQTDQVAAQSGTALFSKWTDATRTSVSSILGTPEYLSPEQADPSRQADHRSDIYGLGCTLYFMFSGQAPFSRPTTAETLDAQRISQPPSLTGLCPEMPSELAQVIQRMMAKSPADRHQSASDVVRALEEIAPSITGLGNLTAEENPTPNSRPNSVQTQEQLQQHRPTHRSNTTRRSWIRFAFVAPLLLALGSLCIWQLIPRQKHVLFVLPEKYVWYDDYGPTRLLLEQENVKVSVASTAKFSLANSDGGSEKIPVDLEISQTDLNQFDALIFLGGSHASLVGKEESAQAFRSATDEFIASQKTVAAICGGIEVLAKNGHLDDRKVSMHSEIKGRFPDLPIQWETSPMVNSRGVITVADSVNKQMFVDEILKQIQDK